MKITSFNVNSIRARLPIILDFLERSQPDILGLQEIKVIDDLFPTTIFTDLGYQVYCFGQKSYHGVALLSKQPLFNLQKGFPSDTDFDEKRLIIAEHLLPNGKKLTIMNGYFPQGENRQHPVKFPAKINFYQNLIHLLHHHYQQNDYILIMGDFNIALEDIDIGIGENNVKRWLAEGKCCFLPEERKLLKEIQNWGFFDTFRMLNQKITNSYSWFDYRSKGFDDNPQRGLRIDYIWCTKPLLEFCVHAEIDYISRGMERPSDHCPVSAEFNF